MKSKRDERMVKELEKLLKVNSKGIEEKVRQMCEYIKSTGVY